MGFLSHIGTHRDKNRRYAMDEAGPLLPGQYYGDGVKPDVDPMRGRTWDQEEGVFPRPAPVPQREPNNAVPANVVEGVFPRVMKPEDFQDTDEAVAQGVYPVRRKVEEETDPLVRQQRLMTEGATKNSTGKRIFQGLLRGLAGGGIPGAILGAAVEGFSPEINREFKTKKELGQTNAIIAEQERRRQVALADRLKTAQTENIYADNARLTQTAEDKSRIADRTLELKEKTLDWKMEDRDRYFTLEELKEKAKQAHNDKLYDFYDRKQKELERHNKASEGLQGQRIAVSQQAESGRNQRLQISIEAKRLAAQVRADEAAGRAKEAQAGRERLLQLKEQYKNLGMQATGEALP